MSTEIDERVVEMRFDNDQFKEGVRDTLEKLKKLKESLNHTDSVKAFGQLDKATQNIHLDGIAAGVEALQKRFSILGLVGLKSLNGIANATINVTKRLYNATIGQIVSGGVKRAMNMENARFQLQALFSKEENAAELVTKVMDDANAAVDGTAYSLDAAAKAASQFAATGIKAGDEMRDALRGIVGVSAMTNSDFESISAIFTTVAGQGRVMGDQLNQLAARGLNAAATMADFANGIIDGSIEASDEVKALVKTFSKGTKITEGDIRDLTSKGKVSFKFFSEAMTDAFADSAEKANETFNGALSNVRSALSRIGAGFISPLIAQNSKIVDLFNALRLKINEFKKSIVFDETLGNVNAVSKQFTDWVLRMAEALTKFIEKIDSTSIMRDFYYGLEITKNIFKALWIIVKPALMAMSGLMKPIGEGLHTIMVALEAVTSRMIASEGTATALGEVLKSIVEILGTLVSGALKLIQKVFKPMNKETKESTTTFAGFLKMIAAVLKSFNNWLQTSPAVTKAFTLLASALSSIFGLLGNIGKIVSGGVIIGFDGLIGGFENLFNVLKRNKVVSAGIDNIQRSIYNLSRFLTSIILPDPVRDYIDQAKAYGTRVSIGIPKIFSVIGDAINKQVENIKLFIKIMSILTNKLKDTSTLRAIAVQMDQNGSSMVTFGTIILEFVRKTMTLENLVNLFKTVIDAGKNFVNFIFNMSESLSGVLVGGGIIYMVTKSFTVMSKSLGAVNGVLNSLGATLNNVSKAVGQMPKTLKAYQNDLNATALIKVAGAIAILSGALILLSFADPQRLLAAAVSVGIVGAVLIAGVSILQKAIKKSKNVWDALDSFGKEVGKAAKWKAISSALKSVGQTILMVTGSIVALAVIYNKDEDSLQKAVSLMAKIGAAIGGFMVVMSILGKVIGTGMKSFAAASVGVMMMASSLYIIFAALNKLFKIELPLDYKRKLAIFQVVLFELAAITGVLAMVTRTGKGGKLNTIPIFLLFTSLHAIVSALKRLFKLSLPHDYKKKLGIFSLIFAELAAVIVALGFANNLAKGKMKGGSAIITMAGFLVTAVGALGLLTVLPMDRLNTATKTLSVIMATLALAIVATSKIANPEGAKTILNMAVSIGAIVMALSILTIYDSKDLLKGTLALSAVMLAMGDVLKEASKIAADSNALLVIGGVAIAMVSAAIALYKLSKQDWKGMAASGAAMYLALKGYAEAFSALAEASESEISFSQVIKFVAAATAAIPLAGALWIISKQPWKSMVASGVALALCIKAYGDAFSVLAETEAIDKKQIVKFAVGATAAIPLAGALWILAHQPWDGILASGAALSACVISYAKAFEIISKSEAIDLDQIKSFLFASVSVIPLGLALGVLAFQPWEGLIGAAASLSATLLAFSACFSIIAKAAIPPAGLVTAFVGSSLAAIPIAIALKIVAGEPWQDLIGSAVAISELLIALSVTMKICSTVGAVAKEALIGLGILAAYIAGLTLLIGLIGGIVDFLGAYDAIQSGLEVLKMIGTGLGEAIGGFVGGILEGATSGLYSVGDNLSLFMEHLQPFLDGCQTLTPDVLAGVGSLGQLIMTLTKADILQGLANFVGGDVNFANLGEQLNKMAPFLRTFADSVAGIDASSVEGAAAAADIINKMAGALPREGGWIDSILGSKKTLSDFAAELVAFGPAIKSFSMIVNGIQPSSVEGAAAAASIMAELAGTLPASDGLVQKIFGDKTLAEFGQELLAFGPAIKIFSEMVKNVDPSSVEGAAAAGNIMATLAENIPNSGGVLGFIMGNNDIDDFGTRLVSYGNAMVSFVETVKTLNPMSVLGVAIATQMMTQLSKALPETGGLVGLITGGKMDFKKFGTQLEKFGNSMAKFSASVAGVDLTVVQSATTALSDILALMISMDGVSEDTLSGFGTALSNLSTVSITEFMTNFQNGGVLVIGAVSQLFTDIINTVTTMTPSVLSTIKMNVDGIALATSFYLPFAFASVKTAMITIGQSVSDGLSIGIRNSIESVRSASEELANIVKTTSSTALEVNSPSKAAESIGDFWGQGLVRGLEGGIGIVKKASELVVSKGIQTPVREILGIHSPALDGEYVGEMWDSGAGQGLIKGMDYIKNAADWVGDKTKNILEKRGEQAADYIAKKAGDQWGDTVYEVYGGIKEVIKGESEEVEKEVKESGEEIVESTSKVKKKGIQQEKTYWEELLKIKQSGIDADKYKDMDLKKFQETTLKETMDVWKTYTDQLTSKRDSIMSSMDIFSEVEKKETVSKEKMKKNIEDQIKAYDQYIQTMASLNARLGDSEFGNYVREMGVDSLDQLKVINSMSDEELTNFVDLYDTKMVYATQAASQQLVTLQAETETKLASLFGGMADAVNVFDFGKVFDGSFQSIDEYVDGVMLPLQESNRQAREEAAKLGEEISGGVTDGLEDANIDQVINEPLFQAFDVARDEQLDNAKKLGIELGEYVQEGMGEGMSAGAFEDAAAAMIGAAEKSLREAGEIHSPSALMQREVGPYITEGVAEGMIDAIPSVNTAITQIVSEIVNRFTENIQGISDSAGTVATAIQNGIGNKKPALLSDVREVGNAVVRTMKATMSDTKMKKIGVNIMNALLKGIRSKTKLLITTVDKFCEDMMKSFEKGLDKNKISAIGLACIESLTEGLTTNTDAAVNAAISVCEAVTKTFEEQMDRKKFSEIGANALEGLLNGTRGGTEDVSKEAKEMANASIDTAKKELDEHSPSRVFFKIGKYLAVGLADGIHAYISTVVKASNTLSKKSGDALKSAMYEIHNIITDDTFNEDITIRPLVDLSNVESSRKAIAQMFNSGIKMTAAGATSAMSTFNGYKNGVATGNSAQNGTSGGGSVVNNYNFEQNNYSPEPLKTIDIYRRTNNQISMLKQRLG